MLQPLVPGRGPQDHKLIASAASLPGLASTPFLSIAPLTLRKPSRPLPIDIRITLPLTGTSHPIILLIHGHGPSNNLSSHNGYAPLAQYYASQGFAVIQPSYLSGKLDVPETMPGYPLFWRARVEDSVFVLDNLDVLAAQTPLLAGRFDTSRIAVVGHSFGAHTASVLLGMCLGDPDTDFSSVYSKCDERIKAGVLLAPGGSGGDSLSKKAWDEYSFFRHPDYATMSAPALIVGGSEDDVPHLSVRGKEWWKDGFKLSPGPKDMLELQGAHHILGGISGWDTIEAKIGDEESPELVAATQRMTLAYLRSALFEGDESWSGAKKAFSQVGTLGSVESK